QTDVQQVWPIDKISIRKGINQLVKMGFIEPYLSGYTKDAPEYIQAKTNRKRQSLLSKIIYSRSSFNSAVNKISNQHQINFLINTLVENGRLTKNEILALMLVDIDKIDKSYLDQDQLLSYVQEAERIDFFERKYNQIGH